LTIPNHSHYLIIAITHLARYWQFPFRNFHNLVPVLKDGLTFLHLQLLIFSSCPLPFQGYSIYYTNKLPFYATRETIPPLKLFFFLKKLADQDSLFIIFHVYILKSPS